MKNDQLNMTPRDSSAKEKPFLLSSSICVSFSSSLPPYPIASPLNHILEYLFQFSAHHLLGLKNYVQVHFQDSLDQFFFKNLLCDGKYIGVESGTSWNKKSATEWGFHSWVYCIVYTNLFQNSEQCSLPLHTPYWQRAEVTATTEKKQLLREPVEALWEIYMKTTLQKCEFLPPSEITQQKG